MFQPLILQAVRATFVLAKFPFLIGNAALSTLEQKIVLKIANLPKCYLEGCSVCTRWVCAACELPTCEPHINEKTGLCPRCEANMIEAAERDEEKTEEVETTDPTTTEPPPDPPSQEPPAPDESPVATKPRLFFINRIANPGTGKN